MSTTPGSAVKVADHATPVDAVDQRLRALRHSYGYKFLFLVVLGVLPFLISGIQTPSPWSVTRLTADVVLYTGISVAAAFFSIRWAVDAFRLAFQRTK